MNADLDHRSLSHSHHGPVKEELHERHISTLPVPPLSSLARYHTSSSHATPPPPPPAAYASPLHEQDDADKDSQASPPYSRPELRHDPDPIPPPPAKYSYPLPSISEALERYEARRASQADRSPNSSPRTQKDAHLPVLRHPYDHESARAPTRSQHADSVAPASYTPSYNQVAHTNALTLGSPTLYPRKGSKEEHQAVAQSSAVSHQTNHFEPYKPTYTRPTEGHYRPPYHPPAPYAPPAQARETVAAPPPAPPAPSAKLYTPSVYASLAQPARAAQAPAWQNPAYPGGAVNKSARQGYGDSVKRHLDGFDLDQSLNGIAESSKELLDFSSAYRQKSHETQRTGPVPGSTPQVHHVDDMMRHGSHIQESLNRLREVIVSQEADLLERSEKAAKDVSEEPSTRQESTKGTGGFANSDPKKRRGRAAPPGKCHSCNRVDTPEWRRGPDGARTLCNACGLHYAKLTRKSGTNKIAQGSSNLRPKDGSP